MLLILPNLIVGTEVFYLVFVSLANWDFFSLIQEYVVRLEVMEGRLRLNGKSKKRRDSSGRADGRELKTKKWKGGLKAEVEEIRQELSERRY